MNQQPYTPAAAPSSPNIILAVASAGLAAIGICGMVPTLLFTLCGIIPIGFGIGAIITGVLAKVKARNDPMNWGGGGLAIGGVIAGMFCIVAPVLYTIVVMVLWYGLSTMGKPGK